MAKRVEHGYEFSSSFRYWSSDPGGRLARRPIEQLVFNGDFKLWLNQTLHARYDQRNNIVIAFGLGLAVIRSFCRWRRGALQRAAFAFRASLALGASRWQTLWRVVLPSASPGIFAAVMIGFGRAVGETMIVLMATGNTP